MLNKQKQSGLALLLFMVVLHTHSIQVVPTVTINDLQLASPDQPRILAPLTRRHVADLVSDLWHSGERSQDAFWYGLYVSETPFEIFEDIPDDLIDQANWVKATVEGHPLIARLIPE